MGDKIGIGWKETALICAGLGLFVWAVFFAWSAAEENTRLQGEKARLERAIERMEAEGYRR